MNKAQKYILIVGGAGYIGAHANKILASEGYDTIVLDNLSYGHIDFVQWGKFIQGNIADPILLDKIFETYPIEVVMHFSAFAYVGESQRNPAKYYQNNVVGTLDLLDAIVRHNIPYFVFSSTCATFGEPQYLPVDEKHRQLPLSPYGKTKLTVEHILKDYAAAYGIKYAILRYFNAAGADPEGMIGEDHDPETHLIPLVLDVALGKREYIEVFGDDYPTKDGTCIRDYIHVNDLAYAHLLAMEWMMHYNQSNDFNLSNGTSFSVKEIIQVAEKVTGKKIPQRITERRAGDPTKIVGSSQKAAVMLNWEPYYKSIEEIMATAWNWHQKCH